MDGPIDKEPSIAALLESALAARVHEMAEQPWLFRREGEDWRWISWADAAHRLAEARRWIAEREEETIAFLADPSPDAYLFDLACRLQQRRALPIEPADEPAPAAGAAWQERGLVLPPGRVVHPLETPAPHLLERALGRATDRDTFVCGRGPADAGERLLLDWSILTGAAALFEHDPARRYATCIWARPSLHQGPGTLLAGLLGSLASDHRTRRRLLRRARMAIQTDEGKPSPEDRKPWEAAGIPILHLGSFLGTGSASFPRETEGIPP